jgi:hypothetical protein
LKSGETKLSDIKLPKQWKDWCAAANLRPTKGRRSFHSRNGYGWFYLEGRGFKWRVNRFAQFERGDMHAEFDRWALCRIDYATIPQTKAEFLATVDKLIAMHQPKF